MRYFSDYMMYYRISKNEKILFFGKKIAQVWAVTLKTSSTGVRTSEKFRPLAPQDESVPKKISGPLKTGFTLQALLFS